MACTTITVSALSLQCASPSARTLELDTNQKMVHLLCQVSTGVLNNRTCPSAAMMPESHAHALLHTHIHARTRTPAHATTRTCAPGPDRKKLLRQIPVEPLESLKAPFITCVAMDRTGGDFERNVVQSGFVEGVDWFPFG